MLRTQATLSWSQVQTSVEQQNRPCGPVQSSKHPTAFSKPELVALATDPNGPLKWTAHRAWHTSKDKICAALNKNKSVIRNIQSQVPTRQPRMGPAAAQYLTKTGLPSSGDFATYAPDASQEEEKAEQEENIVIMPGEVEFAPRYDENGYPLEGAAPDVVRFQRAPNPLLQRQVNLQSATGEQIVCAQRPSQALNQVLASKNQVRIPKSDLIALAMQQLNYTYSKARRTRIHDLCNLFGIPIVDVISPKTALAETALRMPTVVSPFMNREVYSQDVRTLVERWNTLPEGDEKRKTLRELNAAVITYWDSQHLDCIENSGVGLYPYQKQVIYTFLNPSLRGMLVVHGLGTGKTITAIAATNCWLDQNPGSVVSIVAPKSTLISTWLTDLSKYGIDVDLENQVINDPRYKVYSYRQFTTRVMQGEIPCDNELLVVDEVHTLRNPKTITAATIIPCAQQAKKVLLLSATPIVNGPFDLLVIMSMINPQLTQVVEQVINVNDFNAKAFDAFSTQKLIEWFKCMISWYHPTASELEQYYPLKEIKNVYVPMDADTAQAYKVIEESDKKLQDDLEMPASVANMFGKTEDLKSFYNGVRRVSNIPNNSKFQKMFQMIIDVLSNPTAKVLVYSEWLPTGVEVIEQFLKSNKINDKYIKYAKITGKSSDQARYNAVQQYNMDAYSVAPVDKDEQVRVMLISEAGGEGINLKGTSAVFLLEPYFNEAGMRQVIGRAVRNMSHMHLPKSKRIVNVYKMYLVKEPEYNYLKDLTEEDFDQLTLANLKAAMPPGHKLSIDLYLKYYTTKKQDIIQNFMTKMLVASITQQWCG